MGLMLRQDYIIGNNLRRLRENAGYTQEQLAIKLQLLGMSMSRGYYSHIETGNKNISVRMLSELRKIFNCTFDDFFQGY